MRKWLLASILVALAACGPTQSRECRQMLERMDGCTDLDTTTRRLILQMGYEEDGACWEDAEYAEACTKTCIDTMARWDANGTCT